MNQADRFKVRDAVLHKLAGPRVLVMGILNVTPDSFSDGGKFDRTEAALAQAGPKSGARPRAKVANAPASRVIMRRVPGER